MKTRVKATNSSRALYNELVAKYIKNPSYGGNVIITDSWLLFAKSIQGTISSISFDTLVNQGTILPIERRLNITDRFCAAGMSVMIMKAGTTVAATPTEIAIGRPRTFPNPQIFTGANEAANLEAIYNSDMKVTIDSVVYFQSMDIRRFYRAGIAQQGVAISSVALTGIGGADQWDESGYPFAALTPSPELSGIGNNQFVLNTPGGIGINFAGTTSQNFALCYLRGYLIQNVNQK